MHTIVSRGAWIALAASLLLVGGRVEAREPTAEEVAKWKQWHELTEKLRRPLADYTADVKSGRDASPFYGNRSTSLEKWQEKARTLVELSKSDVPTLRAALAELQQKYGSDKDAMTTKFFEEFGQPIDPRAAGFSRRVSPDRKRWLPTHDYYPFLYYERLEDMAEVPEKWWELAATKAAEYIGYRLKDPAYSEERMQSWERVTAGLEDLRKLDALIPPAQAALEHQPDHGALKQAISDVQARIALAEKHTLRVIDAYQMSEDVEKLNPESETDVDALREAMLEQLQQKLGKEEAAKIVAIRIPKSWDVYKKDLIHRPIQYAITGHVYLPLPEDHPDAERLGTTDLAQVQSFRFYTEKVSGVKPDPPFRSASLAWTGLMRPGNVSGGAGFFGTLFRIVFGLVCCTGLLMAVAGGGYFVWTQTQAQKALATVTGQPAGEAGGAQPSSVPHAPPGSPGQPAVPPAPPGNTPQPPAPPTSAPPADPNQPPPTQG